MLQELALDLDLRKVGHDVKVQLAKPNKQILKNIREITTAELEGVEINGLPIFTFSVPHKVQRRVGITEEMETITNPDIKMIKEEMLIKLTWYNKERVNWFRISKITQTDSQEFTNMEIQAEGLPSELRATNVYFTEDPINIQEYFTLALEQSPWKLGVISDKLKDTYRSFDDSKKTKYEAVQNGLETFGAIADWNEEDRILNLVSISDLREFRGIVLKKENYMSSLEVESTSEDIVTRMYAYGSEGLGIEKQNPTGMPYLEDYSYFIAPFERDENKNVLSHSHFMSDELCHALLDLIELQKEYNPRIKQLQELVNQAIKDLSKAMLEKVELEGEVITIEALLDTAKSTNDKPLIAQREHELVLKKQELADKIEEIENIQKSIETWEKTIASYQELISTSSFEPKLVAELSLFIYEKEFNDDRYIDDKDLYEASVKEFEKYQNPVRSFTIELASFVNSIEGQRVKDRLQIGEEIIIKSTKLETKYKSIILGYSVDFLDGTYSLHISDNMEDIDAMDRLATLIYKADSSSTILNNNKYKWDNISIIKDEVEKWRTQEIDTVNKRIIAGANESITIDNYGIQAMNPDFPNERIIIQSGVMALSKDGGKTWSTSITPDGVIAETIIGKIIAGNNLIITNDNGTFVIDSTGMTVDMDSIHIMSGQSGSKEDLIQLWNNLLLTYEEIADDSKVNEYEKNQLEKQWRSIENIHSSMITSFEKGWKQQISSNPIVEGESKKEIEKPYEYNQYIKAYEELNKYLNQTKQSDNYALLDPANRKETTDIDSVKFQKVFQDYEKAKQAFESIVSLEFTKASIEVLESGISLNYTRNKEIVTQLNLSEEGIKIDGKLLEINADTEFNANLTMNAGVIQDKNKDIIIDLNKGEIVLNKPIKIGTGSNIATKEDIEKAQVKAYTMVLSNDMSLVPTDKDGVNGNYTTAVTTAMIYKGAVDDTRNWTFSVNVSGGVTGKLVGSKYTVSNMTSDNGLVTMIAKKDDLTLTKGFQISKVRAGKDGAQGETGKVKMLTLSADSYVMTFTNELPKPEKQSIVVKAEPIGLNSEVRWTFIPYGEGNSLIPITKTPKDNKVTITQDDLKGNIDLIKIIADCDGFEDTMSIVKVRNGDGIKSSKVEYQLSDSGTTRPTGVWSTSMPSTVKGKYMWTRTTSIYTDGTSIETFLVTYIPLDGQKGQDGAQGANGTGIVSTTIEYQTHLSGVTAPTGTWLKTVPNTPKGAYLWTRTTIKYSDNTQSVSYSTSYFAMDGEKGETPVTGFLTNESITLGSDQNGIVSDFNGATGVFEVYDGLKRVTGSSVKYSVLEKHLVDGTIGSDGTYRLTRMDSGATVLNGFIELKAVYNNIQIIKRLSVAKAVKGAQGQQGQQGQTGKDGASATAYWLTPTVNVLSTTASGLINPQSIGFNAYSKTGTQNVVAYKGLFEIETSTNGTSYTNVYRSSALEATKTYQPPKGTKFVRVKLYDTLAKTSLLDEQTIPVLDTNGELFQAWANSADGKVDFSRVMPRENLFDYTLDMGNHWTPSWSNHILNIEKTADGIKYTATTSGQTGIGSSMKTLPKKDDVYIVTVKARGTGYIEPYFMSTKSGNLAIGQKPTTSTTEWQTFVWSVKLPKDYETIDCFGFLTRESKWVELKNGSAKLEKVEDGKMSPTIYIPSTVESKTSYPPQYVGYSTSDSNNPSDYKWSANSNNVKTYKAWANSENGFIDFTKVYPNENTYSNNKTIISGIGKTPVTKIAKNTDNTPNGFEATGSQDATGGVRLNNVITSNGYWTISFMVRGSQNVAVGFNLDICDLESEKIYTETNNQWKKVVKTVNVTNHSDTYNFVDFDSLAWAYFFVKDIKIEKGKKATQFTSSTDDSLIGSVMRYVGISVKDSDNPSDYEWIYSAEYTEALTQSAMDDIKHTADNALNLSENAVKKEEFYSWLEQDYEQQMNTIKDISDSNKRDLLNLNSRTTIVENNFNDMKVKWNFIDQSISFSEEGMFISNQKSKMAIQVSSDKIVFWDNNVDVAFITGEMLNITRGVFLESATIGNHVITKYSDTSPVTLIRYIGKV